MVNSYSTPSTSPGIWSYITFNVFFLHIIQVNDAKSEEEINVLAVDPEIATVLSNSGFIEPLSTRNKQRALHYIMLNDIVLKRKSELEQLRDGLNDPFKLIDFLSRHEKETTKVFPHPEDVKLVAEDIIHIMITEPNYHLDEEEEKVFAWLHQYIEQIGKRTGGEFHSDPLCIYQVGKRVLY